MFKLHNLLPTYKYNKTFLFSVPGDGGSQIDAKLDKPSVVHYLCDKKTNDYYNIWLNLELLVPYVIDCLVSSKLYLVIFSLIIYLYL